ncbi:MAG TPA: Crp/Fnr family transcriptional regulator [Candidatus Gracilibacteria bacterium]|nr:Crp/Fnr family transcriptional regulator [Candidatus Gracilibacteria bacterium]
MSDFIQNCFLFQNLNTAEAKRLMDILVLREFRPKEFILRAGGENNYMFIILEGVIKIDTHANSRRQTLSFLKEGDVFGEITMFTDSMVSANVVSVVKSKIYTLHRDNLYTLVKEIPQLALNIIAYLANRVKGADRVIYDYAFKMLEARVSSKILSLMKMFKGEEDNKKFINLPVTHQDLADFVGTSRETITKILTKFKDHKLIDVQTKKIIILDEKGLAEWDHE